MPKKRTPGLVSVGFVVDAQALECFREICEEHHMSMSEAVRNWMHDFVMKNWTGDKPKKTNNELLLSAVLKDE